MQKHFRQRGQKSHQKQTFSVSLAGHNINMTREQVLANGQGWKRCHGEHDGTTVNSLSVKRIGDKIFVKDKGNLSGYDIHELAVAMPEIKAMIDTASALA